ncbi:MAG: VOC family protein [Spirochaetia bacterium]
MKHEGLRQFLSACREPAIILKTQPDARPTIWFTVDNVTEEFDQLKARGVRFVSDPFQIRTGLAVEFEDPFGNRLGITDYSAQPPSRPNEGIQSIEKE